MCYFFVAYMLFNIYMKTLNNYFPLIYSIEMWRVIKMAFSFREESYLATNYFYFRVWVYSPIGDDWCYKILSLRLISSSR